MLSITILFILTSCGVDKATTDDFSTTENTTSTTTSITTTTTRTITEATTDAEATENTQKATEINKPETTTGTKPTEIKPTETKVTEITVTETKPTETVPKSTEPKQQKEAPKFVFTQNLPIKVTVFGAEFEVINAYTQDGYWYDDNTYLFVICITMKRYDDGINEERASNVKMTIKDANGNIVRTTSTGAGMLGIGEQGSGSMAWSVDGPGTYTIEFSSI